MAAIETEDDHVLRAIAEAARPAVLTLVSEGFAERARHLRGLLVRLDLSTDARTRLIEEFEAPLAGL